MSDWERISAPTKSSVNVEPATGDWERIEAKKPSGAYDRFLDSLRNPQTGGRSGVVGPMLVGGTGELIKGAGALTQLAFPEAGTRMVEVGEAMTEGAKSVAPVSTTVGQVGSYLVPFTAAQKTATAIGNVPQVARTIGQLPSFARATGQQAAIGGALGYGLTPDQQNREQAGVYGTVFGGATPTIEKGIRAVGNFLRGTSPSQGTMQAAREAQEAGYVIPPTQVKPSLINRILEGTAGKLTTAQNASFKNQQVTNQLAARSLGLPDDVVITPEILTNIRANAGKAYETLGATGTIKTSPKFVEALDNIKVYKDAVQASKDFPTAQKNPIIDVIEPLKQKTFDVQSAVSKINVLRNDADMAYRAGNKDLGKANKEASQVLENTIENYLANTKQTDLLQKFREARQTIAKTYSVENALNQTTGSIDAKKLAAQLAKGKPLSGELKQAGQFAQAFPTAAKTTESMGSLPQISPLDIGGAVITGGGAYLSGSGAETPATLAALLARPTLRAAALSRPVQSRLTNQQMQQLSPDVRNLARMLMLQGATKAGANEEQK
jgi:hypothetical protein